MVAQDLSNNISMFLSNSSGIWVHDIEADGLYHKVTKAHCMWVIDAITNASVGFRPDEMEEGVRLLEKARVLIAHNGIDYDTPALKKLYPSYTPPPQFDTLVIARMLQPDRLQGHSLDSWGQTLGCYKDSFGKTADWSTFSEEMYIYCKQDVVVNVKLYKHLCMLAKFDEANPPSSTFYY